MTAVVAESPKSTSAPTANENVDLPANQLASNITAI